jgi:DNA-binding response OmpR family regulator/tetratricopeptide (TPR) repeat protein
LAKRSLLLVDSDIRSLRVLEVSLKKAGFNVTTAENGRHALDIIEAAQPDLVISDTDMPEMDGFELCRRLKDEPSWGHIPIIFLTGQSSIEHKVRGLELGVEDYLTKPIYIKEILTRVRILLQKAERASLEEKRDGRTRFSGQLADMGVVDLIQTIEVSRKSGLIHFAAEGGGRATLYFRDGKVIDAEAGHLQGEDAVYRLLTWSDGEFEVLFRQVRRKDAIAMSSQALLMEGMRRLDEWGRIQEQIPPLSRVFQIDYAELADRLAELPDELNALLRLFDGRRSLMEIIDAAEHGDLETLEVISKLYFEGLIVERDASAEPEEAEEPMALSGGSLSFEDRKREADDGFRPHEGADLDVAKPAEVSTEGPAAAGGESDTAGEAGDEAQAAFAEGEGADEAGAASEQRSEAAGAQGGEDPLQALVDRAIGEATPVLSLEAAELGLLASNFEDVQDFGADEAPVAQPDAEEPVRAEKPAESGEAALARIALVKQPLGAVVERTRDHSDSRRDDDRAESAKDAGGGVVQDEFEDENTPLPEPQIDDFAGEASDEPLILRKAAGGLDPMPVAPAKEPARTPSARRRHAPSTVRIHRGPRVRSVWAGGIAAGVGLALGVAIFLSMMRSSCDAAEEQSDQEAATSQEGAFDSAGERDIPDVGEAGANLGGTPSEADENDGVDVEEPRAEPEADSATDTSSAEVEPEADADPFQEALAGAHRAHRAGAHEAALQHVDEALTLAPRSSLALSLKAEILMTLRRTAEAREPASRAVEFAPRRAPAWFTKGMVHYELGEREQAREALERYLQLRPEGRHAGSIRLLLEDL